MRRIVNICINKISHCASAALALLCVCLMMFLPHALASKPPIVVGLLDSNTIMNNSGGHFHVLNNFVFEYWQAWGKRHQRGVKFVYLPGENVFDALDDQKIDVVGLTTITSKDSRYLYSIPYARFKQRIFKHLQGNNQNGIQLAINSPRASTLGFLDDYVDRDYYHNIDEMLENYQSYDALYSIRPWALEKKLSELHLTNQFYISTDEAPNIHFHFATRQQDRELMYAVNEGLRQISKAQAEHWAKKFLTVEEDNFSFTVGDYIQNLTEAEKQYVIDHNHVTFPIFPSGFPPYIINKSFININERGLTMDMLKHATKKIGLIFDNVYIDDLKEGAERLDNKSVDFFAIANKNYAKIGKERLHSLTYANSRYSLIHRLNNPIDSNIKSLADIQIAAIKGFSLTEYLQRTLPTATIKQFNTINDAIYAVAKGEVDAYIGESLNNAYVIKHEKLANLTSVPMKKFNLEASFSFASRLDNASLITLLNRSINSMPVTEFDNSYEAWSKTAFSNASAKKEVQDAYNKAAVLLMVVISITLLITRFYIKQINFRKASQLKVEQALSVAEKARKEAERSAQAKINFLARMSHEIRTPMNGILGMAESLTFTQLSEEQKNYLSTLTDSAGNLLVLLNDILDFAKMDAGKLTLESQAVNVKELAELAIKAFSYIEKEKNIDLKLTLDKSLHHRYYTDPFRLTQVLNNLISNAVKFTDLGTIQLSIFLVERTTENDETFDSLKISVKDSGIGIAEEKQKQLFSPFIQADSAVTRKYGGTGLGLSICQEIAGAMDSKISIKSTPDIGSEFYFYLSLKQCINTKPAEDRRKLPRNTNVANTAKFEEFRVLMAEDNIVNVKVLSAQLERLNITADIAENGDQALKMFEKSPYDIVISDCHMPILDGYELANILSPKKHNNRPWLIAITADALEGTAEQCLNAGFDDYIAKPCTQETVNNKLHHAMRQITLSDGVTDEKEPSPYQFFRPAILEEHHHHDLSSSERTCRTFLAVWQDNQTSLFTATLERDFHRIYTLVQRLQESMNYFDIDAIDKSAALIQKQAQSLQADAIEYTVKLFISELTLLAEEIEDWLLSLSQ